LHAAAGLLLSLCADEKGKEQVVRGKTSGANGSSCCQVLHGCLANPAAAPRHVMGLLAALASHPIVSACRKLPIHPFDDNVSSNFNSLSHKVSAQHPLPTKACGYSWRPLLA
jgi:hypothetical protein